MANIDIDSDVDFPVTAAITGSERIGMSDAGTPKHVTPDLLSAYIIDDIEGISALATCDSGDSFMVLENDTNLKPCTYEVVQAAFSDTMWAKTAETAVADADKFPMLDANGPTKKTVTATLVADYVATKKRSAILNVSDITALSPVVDGTYFAVVDGTTPKSALGSVVSTYIYASLDTHVTGLAAVTTATSADVLYTIQGGVAKKVTLSTIISDLVGANNVTGPASVTVNNIPQWSATDTLKDGLTLVSTFVAGAATAVPTSAAVRTEMDEIINDATAMGAAIVDADTILIDDGAAGTQRKATFTQVAAWVVASTFTTLTGTTITDGTWSTTAGAFTGIASLDGGGTIDLEDNLDGTGFTVTAGTFTDGTMTITGGDITDLGDVTFADVKNIAFNTGTGTKIGTATGQKIGFWNAAPVIQQSHISDPAAMAAVTFTSHNWDGATDPTQAEGDKIVADLAAIKTAVDANNTAIDSINAMLAATGLTAAS